MKKVVLFICLLTLLTSCQTTSITPPTSASLPDTPGPSSTPKPTPTPKPTKTPLPTPDPLAKYEGDCPFCWINANGNNPLEPVFSPANQGFTNHADDPREKITIDENFTVGVGESVTIENKIIIIKPTRRKNIEVFGVLTIKNSLLLWEQTEYQQTRLVIKRGGTLNIENSYSFQGNRFWVNWEYEDGSTIYFDHYIGDAWASIHGSSNYTAINYSTVKLTFFKDTHDTTVNVTDAHHVWFEVFPPEGTHTITFPEKRKWADWEISDMWPNTTVNVKSSYIFERDISMSNNTHVTVQDTPSGFSMGWTISKDTPGFVDCELKNLGKPGDPTGVFYEDMTWDLPCVNSSLTIKKSLLQRAWPNTYGYVHLKVSDSCLADTASRGPSTMEIYNSSIELLFADNGAKIYIENSIINQSIEVRNPRSIIYGYGVSGRYQLLESDGGAYVKVDEMGPPWK